jgi:hypothetical protein
LALELLEQSPNEQFWRVHWFAAVILVRTVGDVLDKVDSRDSAYRKAIVDAYRRWKNDKESSAIFWEFIKPQRDKLVHEYDSDVHPLDRVSLAVEFGLVSMEDGATKTHGEVFEIDESIYRPMLEGRWQGDDGRDVLREAITWWIEQLDAIEAAVSKSSS